jgi:protein SCO1/2
VSITVDPKHDTPKVLQEYAKRYGADPERWLFLTGEKRTIYHLAQDGFRLAVQDPGEKGKGDTFWPFGAGPAYASHGSKGLVIHSSRLVLVDRQARTRGYYDGTDLEALKRLRRDVNKLLRER